MTRTADALAPAKPRAVVRFLFSLPTAPTRRQLWLYFCLVAATVGVMVFTTQLLGRLVDLVTGASLPIVGSGRQAMVYCLIIISGCLILETGGRILNTYLQSRVIRHMSVTLRQQALDAVLKAPVPRILELGTGNVITRLSKDIDNPVMIWSQLGSRVSMTAFMLPLTILSIVLIHPLYGVLFLFSGALLYPWITQVLRDMPPLTNLVSSAEARRNNVVLDTIRALDTLRQFRLNQWASRRMESVSWQTVQAWGDRIPVLNRLLGQGTIAYGLLLLGALAMSVPMISADLITPGQAAAAVMLISRLEIHVFNMLFFAGEIQESLTALGRAVSLAQIADDQACDSGVDAPASISSQPAIEIDNLSYSYPGGAQVLNNLSLRLAPGTTTALVGTSGAGKSTLAALIAGLQYPTSGRILIDGVDTATVPNTWLAQQISLITQDIHLFSGTLREDLLLAAPGAADDALLEALRQAGLVPGSPSWQRWLPQGLDTLIGAGHEEVGPDIAQQISLARMVLRQPPVLIMDEATSEAGSEHARSLEDAARAVTANRTALIVAHRLDQARQADRIIVMEGGDIVEDGNHASLMARNQRYARAYRQWEHGR